MTLIKPYKTLLYAVPVILILMTSCATDKDAWLNRNFHSMTTRFNGYFNGKESLKEGVAQIENQHQEDYNNILPVFQYGDQSIASAANSYMDNAIKKATVQISKRTMFIRGQEKNRWIDDCWLLIGKAHFYKMEYDLAMQNFDFVIARYKDKPSRYEAMLWKIRTNTQQKKFSDNEALIGMLDKNIRSGKVSFAIKQHYHLVKADHFLKQGSIESAIQPLNSAIKLNWNKKTRIRARFILAQILQEQGKTQEASAMYKKVIKMNPPYELAFNAKINMARCFAAEKGDGRTIKKYLNKMIRDEKNLEYLDQVYFALAEVYMKEKNDSLAMYNLKYSVAKSTTNNNQKAISSLLLADLYFKYENYPDAQAYYDSAVTYLQPDFPNYKVLMTKHDILSRLVNNIMVVHTQDSLQRLARMPANERMRIVNGIIAEISRKEQEAKEAESNQFQNMGFLEMENRNINRNQQQTSEWIFDNPASRSFGYTEFRNKWGDRPLEDMWRLSSKRGAGFMTEEELVMDSIRQDSIKAVIANLKNPDFYLKNIPLTPDAINASDLKIEKALYNMGYIYFHDLADADKSIESFEIQIKRYPKGEMIPPAYYQLHQVYLKLGFNDKAGLYQNLLTTEHPEHEYALILADPEYFLKRAKEIAGHKTIYSNAYQAYKNGDFKEAKTIADAVLADPSLADVHPKFSLLNALLTGYTSGRDAYLDALGKTSVQYQSTPEGAYALELINILAPPDTSKVAEKSNKNLNPETIDYSIYRFGAAKPHLVLVIIDSKFGKPERVKNKISDFNLKSFSPKNLNVTTTVLSDNFQMLTISNFSDGKDAMIYYDALIKGDVVTGKDAEGESYAFAISTDNYPIFFKDKVPETYMAFFTDHYLK